MSLKVGTRVRVAYCSGIDSNLVGTVVNRLTVQLKQTNCADGMIPDIPGEYKPADWRRQSAVKLDDGGRLIIMFDNRLIQLK